MPPEFNAHTAEGVLIGELLADVGGTADGDADAWIESQPPHWLLQLTTAFDLAAWAGGSTVTVESPVRGAQGLVQPDGRAWTVQQRVPRFVDKTVIGRGRSCDIIVPDPGVSKRHAFLSRSDDGLVVVDAGSRNGTFVNGAAIEIGARAVLEDGDILQLGPAVALCFVLSSTLRVLIDAI